MKIKIISKDGVEQLVEVNAGQAARLPVQPGAHYQFVDAQGKPLAKLKAKRQGADLELTDEQSGESVVLEDYYEQCAAEACAVESAAGGQLYVGEGEGVPASLDGLALGEEAVYALAPAGMPLAGYFAAAGGLLAAAAVGGGGGGGGGAAAAVAAAASYTISGGVAAGPVVSEHGLTVTAYDKDGKELGTSKLDSEGKYSITVKNGYKGVVLVKVTDADSGADYRDEATGKAQDLTVDLRAAGTAPGGNITININPLSELAVRKLGIAADAVAASATAEQVSAINSKLGELFGLSGDITGQAVAPVIKADGSADSGANAYGKVLALLSGLEAAKSVGMEQVLEQLAAALEGSAASLSWKSAEAAAIRADLIAAAARVESAAGVGALELLAGLKGTPFMADDGVAPALSTAAVSALDASGAAKSGALMAGDKVRVTLTMSEAVVVGGVPELAIELDSGSRQAKYVSGSGSATLVFEYVVAPGDANSAGGIDVGALVLPSGAVIVDVASQSSGTAAATTQDNALQIDASAPTASLTTATTNAPASFNAVVQSSEPGSAYLVNSTVTVTDAASITGAADNLWNSVAIASANSDINLAATGLADGNYKLYTVDAAGNLSAASSGMVSIDTTPPVISSSSLDMAENGTAAGTLAATDAGAVTWALAAGGADNGLFTLGSDGALSFNAAPDFEAPGSAAGSNAYSVKVSASDAAGNVTTQDVSVNVTNSNEAPLAPASIADQAAAKGQVFSFTVSGFSDPDAGDSLTYNASGLPAGLSIDAVTGVISGTPSAAAAAQQVTVTATDSGGLTATQSFNFSVVSAPVLSSAVSGVTNFDVRSNIVLTASEDVALSSTGTYTITITNTGGTGYRGENAANTQTLTITNGAVSGGGSVTISGNKIVIDPTWDLDFANDYTVSVDAGAFTGATSGQPSSALAGLSFATVMPGSGAGGIGAAAASQALDGNGALVSGLAWLDVSGLGSALSGSTTSFSAAGGDYAFVIRDADPAAAPAGNDGVSIDGNLSVKVTEWGAGDLFYVDNQTPSAANDMSASAFGQGNGTSAQPLNWTQGGNGTDGYGEFLIVLESGLSTTNTVLASVVTDIVSTTGMVISA